MLSPLPNVLTLSVMENLRFFDLSKGDPESNKTPTNNWADFIHFRDDLGNEPLLVVLGLRA